jgi:hypothetical protein
MADRPWWSYAIQWGAWFVIMSIVMGWLSKSRVNRPVSNNPGILQYPLSLLVIGIICSVFFIAASVFSLTYLKPTDTFWPVIVFAAFASLGVWIIAECLYIRHALEAGGLRYRSWAGGWGFLPWEDIIRVRYSESAGWFRLEGRGGEVVRISVMLTSLPEFACAILRAVPQKRIDPNAHNVLKSTAAGSLPKFWR